jgi:imidazole glycerol-phosphate synthase subunit HisH
MIAVINYGAGNLGSVVNAINRLGYKFEITSSPEKILAAKAVVLPGVGAAGDCMEKLVNTGVAETIVKLVAENRPILAICVGLQVLLTGTEEGGWHKCMNLVPGKVKRLPPGLKIPHMGWNQVKQEIKHPIFNGIPDKTNFYFVHSYYADPDDKSVVATSTEYGIPFCSMVIKNNLIATQFHPEKSSAMGLKMYSNFFEMAIKGHK